MKAIAEERATRKGLDAKKYAGRLKRGLDGLTYQKQARDEWDSVLAADTSSFIDQKINHPAGVSNTLFIFVRSNSHFQRMFS